MTDRPAADLVVRTPPERFAGLPDYPWPERWTTLYDETLGALRMHHVEAGPADGPVALLLHGEPTWSFLWRKVIPLLAAEGWRVLAPDLIGFGKSDKPVRTEDYAYARHLAWLTAWMDAQGLRDVRLLCQDWGGLLGLRLVAADPDRFAAVVVANTGLPDGTARMSDAFLQWRDFALRTPDLPVGVVVAGGCRTELSPEVVAAYDAPFPERGHKAGARVFPALVPVEADDPQALANREAWTVLERFHKPFLTAFSDQDPVTAGGERPFQTRVPGARGRAHPTITGAGHFLQEDAPAPLARAALDLFARTR